MLRYGEYSREKYKFVFVERDICLPNVIQLEKRIRDMKLAYKDVEGNICYYHIDETKERTTIGQNDDCDICLKDTSLYRVHAMIIYKNGSFWICEPPNSSFHGTKVDGMRLQPGEVLEILDGSCIQCGRVEFHVLNDQAKYGQPPSDSGLYMIYGPPSVPDSAYCLRNSAGSSLETVLQKLFNDVSILQTQARQLVTQLDVIQKQIMNVLGQVSAPKVIEKDGMGACEQIQFYQAMELKSECNSRGAVYGPVFNSNMRVDMNHVNMSTSNSPMPMTPDKASVNEDEDPSK